MATHSLQTQLFRAQLVIALLFLTGTLVFCWRMILVDQAIEQRIRLGAQMNVLHHVIEIADVGAADGAERERLRSRMLERLGLSSHLDRETLDLANLAERAARTGGEDAVRLGERRSDASRRYEDLERAVHQVEADYRRQGTWAAIAWSMILVLPLVLATWPLRLSQGVVAGIRRLGEKVELGRRTGDGQAVVIDRLDEVGELGAAIDEMFRTIRQRDEELTLARQLRGEEQKLSDIVNVIGGIAHEVANPLSIILANLESKERLCDNCEVDVGETSPIREGLSRIHALLRDITAFTSGDYDVDMVDVNGVTRGILRIVCLDERMRSSRVESVLDPDLPAVTFSAPVLTLVVFSMISEAASVLHGASGELHVITTANADALTIGVTARRASETLAPARQAPSPACDSSTLVSMGRVLQSHGGILSVQTSSPVEHSSTLSLPLRGPGEGTCSRASNIR